VGGQATGDAATDPLFSHRLHRPFDRLRTGDHALNPLIRANQRLFYDLLFRTVRDVLQEFARERLGCELGLTAVLHTWGQKLDEHVHIHCIVTGGGLARDGRCWVRPKSKRYLFDVEELSAAYRDKLLGRVERGQWDLPKRELKVVETVAEIQAKKWEVFIKPFEEPQAVIEYLSRYVHQVAISNYRLLKLEDDEVTFEYYENRERAEVGGKGKLKRLTLPVEEFIRRWLSHVLPRGYKRIRYYGLHHSSARAEKLLRCRKLLGLAPELPEIDVPSLAEWLAELLGDEVDRCPQCGATGSLIERTTFAQLPWLVSLILSLFGQPTTVGVGR
jgi:hypothetical protein